jgi:hypothetical protein
VHGKEESDFPPVDFSCLAEKFHIALRAIDIFERANAHFNIGVTVLQYETEFQKGVRFHKKRVIFPVRARRFNR